MADLEHARPERERENVLNSDLLFSFVSPLTAFEKSSANGGEKRRIAGVISTEDSKDDVQTETILQDYLDFAPFMKNGVFNDDHSKATDSILGYPSHVEIFSKGERLPDDTFAPSRLSWAEGWLLDGYEPADKIWSLAKALAKAGNARRLGFSVEGSILQRSASDRKIVTKAVVTDCAITRKAINQGTRLEVLAKSLTAASATGMSLQPESLDSTLQNTTARTLVSEARRKRLEAEAKAGGNVKLTKSEAFAYVAAQMPTATPEQILKIVAHVERRHKRNLK